MDSIECLTLAIICLTLALILFFYKTFKEDITNNPKRVLGTSFHNYTINASFYELTDLFGLPLISFEEKVNYEWNLTYEGISFTLYDWKYYRPLLIEEPIEWHIGTKTKSESEIVKNKIEILLKNEVEKRT